MTVQLNFAKAPTSKNWLAALSQLGPVVGLIAIIVFFSVRASDNFPTFENAQNILQQTAIVGTAAIGATIVIIAAGIDLSVGSLVALTSVVAALKVRPGLTPPPTVHVPARGPDMAFLLWQRSMR